MTIWVLMTSMPPTKGHGNLIRFASEYGRVIGQNVKVILCTQPNEPFVRERYLAVSRFANEMSNVKTVWMNDTIEQNPEAPGFWDMWKNILRKRGAVDGDTYIASEPYGAAVADHMQGRFIPYDPYRELYPCKATTVRHDLEVYWDNIMPNFASELTATVTIFGAESTGKTTLAKKLSRTVDSHFVFEYARPYLENRINEITVETMTDIWQGQLAVQRCAKFWTPEPWIIQDTDLYSTVGYWQFPHWQDSIGSPPVGLLEDAHHTKSDLYLITKSNIPFEPDPLRYGGDVREGSDEYWINIAQKHRLNYKVLESDDINDRHDEAIDAMEEFWYGRPEVKALVEYDREGF
jgi:NadR type nicotinamide-nucleotide adenylyltransferase